MRFVDPKTSDTSRGSVDSLPAAGAQGFGWEADVRLMFRRLSEPLPLSEASLLALRPALNAPVLNVGFLPVGPARAAIVVFAEEWGGIGLALGIRSNEAGRVAVFRNQESIAPDVTIPDALEPALAEAERMGFLFDEDVVAAAKDGQGRLQAMELWGGLMGEVEMPPAVKTVEPEPVATTGPVRELPPASASPSRAQLHLEADELVLEEVVDLVLVEPVDTTLEEIYLDEAVKVSAQPARGALPSQQSVASKHSSTSKPVSVSKTAAAKQLTPPAVALRAGLSMPSPGDSQRPQPITSVLPVDSPSVASAPEPVQAQKLSKFRHLDEAVAAEESEEVEVRNSTGCGANELGRIPLLRVRKGRNGSNRVSYLARLLANF